MADFEPRELDELEDALELLSADEASAEDPLAGLELSPALEARLGEYADVLALCREAFPVEEPGEDILADVLAEAHAVSVSARPSPRDEIGADASAWQRFWERWRGTLIPGFALAGTAAAVLWILEPGSTDTAALLDDPSAEERSPGEADSDEPTAPSEPAMPTPAAIPDPAEDGPGEADSDDAGGPANDDSVGAKKVAATRSKSAGGEKPPAQEAQVQEAQEAREPMTKGETWSAIDDGDKARKSGRCSEAQGLYQSVLERSQDSAALARAKAGVGLCYHQDRRSTDAESWFDQARDERSSIDEWIEEQLDEQPLPSKKKPSAKKKKKSAKMPANMDEESPVLDSL